jgi:hypothetical protein
MRACVSPNCPRPATIPIRTTRPNSDVLKTTVFWGGDGASRLAQWYCRLHFVELMSDFAATFGRGPDD